MVGLAIHQITRGYTTVFGGDDTENQEAVENIFISLGVSFAGLGTLLCLIHNFYGISRSI